MTQKRTRNEGKGPALTLSSIARWGVAALALIALLELFSSILLSWIVIGSAICYALWHVVNQCKGWWRGRNCKVAQRERFLKLLASLMGLFLATGSALFLQALYYTDEGGNFVNAEFLLRSIICSLDLFMLDIDSNVLDAIKEHAYLKGLISIQAVLSFSCTVAVLISLIYARVAAYIKLHQQTSIDNEHNHLYIFFGLNEASRLLIKSIKQKEGERARVIIVGSTHINEDNNNGWDSIVGLFTHRKQVFIETNELDARITFTETKLSDIDNERTEQGDILGELNLRMTRTLIQKLETVKQAELHIFFLSDDEDDNLLSLSKLALDGTINRLKSPKKRFYCHVRRNGLNRIVEDIAVKRGLEVRIIDSTHLAVETLKADETCHPVRLVEIDKDNQTTVKSAFHSLIIGFDEAGQDAFRFLYEFGTFIDKDSTPDNAMRSPFHCTAIDTRMNQLRSIFSMFAPAVMEQRNRDNTPLVVLKECDARSEEYYNEVLDPVRDKLNYVVIAVGDDESGMMLAVNLFNYIRKFREDLRYFRIFVRSYRSDKEAYMQKVADHYNEGYNNDSQSCYRTSPIIIPFGKAEKIYSYDMIINDKLIADGKRFQEGYARMKGEKQLWDERRACLLGTDIPIEMRKISLNNIRKLRRKESQDLANALHAGTKIYLLKQTQGTDYDWKDFLARYFNEGSNQPKCEGKYDKICYPELTAIENRTILNLACLEHLRWNSSHEMLGYRKACDDLHGCDERTRQHNCLRSWDEMDKESAIVTQAEGWEADYKLFDFGVVDNTLFLYKEKLLAPPHNDKEGSNCQ